jgi:hypothetical protein
MFQIKRLDLVYRKQHIAIESQNVLKSKIEMVEAKLKFVMELIIDIKKQKESFETDKINIPELMNLDTLKLEPQSQPQSETQPETQVRPESQPQHHQDNLPITLSIMDRIQKYEFIFDSLSDRKSYISWSKTNDSDYKPTLYTAVAILKNPNADPDLLT